MHNPFDSSQFSRISGCFHCPCEYESSTVVIPKRNTMLPSIYEINSDQRFPNHMILDGFIYGDYHNDMTLSKNEPECTNDIQNSLSDDTEKIDYKNYIKEDVVASPSIEQHPGTQCGQIDFYSQQINNSRQVFQICSPAYNPNNVQILSNQNLEQRYFVPCQKPLNSIITQISDDMNSPYMEKSHLFELHPPNQNVSFISFQNPIENQSRIILDPVELNFIPTDQWTKGKVSLDTLKKDFFCARSSKCLRFEYKLWNALQITKHYPFLFKEIGVKWVA